MGETMANLKTVCKDMELPDEFATFLEYCRKKVAFSEKPNYDYLRNLLRDLLFKENYEFDRIYDWTNPPDCQSNKKSSKALEDESTREGTEYQKQEGESTKAAVESTNAADKSKEPEKEVPAK